MTQYIHLTKIKAKSLQITRKDFDTINKPFKNPVSQTLKSANRM